ncbi:F-box/kelch-repeat protein [Trifolium pratense]|uniref:F-box/kelch-repeat protein n=1 Tax=Trifolium pratense TaxID=57577 RepID=A0A2K3LU09_TRIPR|nr:F-box/kelch-repeat protein [Trifolium pratense]
MEAISETLTSPSSLPTLPFDLISEILCNLPVKLLLQLQCVCKSWKSLISDHNFAKKHLRKSTPRLMIQRTKLRFPNSLKNKYCSPSGVCSCDGILCFVADNGSFVLWNPSIRKFKILPPLNNAPNGDFWRTIQDFPHSSCSESSGVFVSGTINWLTEYYDHDDASSISRVIVSLDLAKETYQKLSLPDLNNSLWTLGVLKDCLCICARSWGGKFLEVWVMNEFGNKESWAKLHTVSYTGDGGPYVIGKPLYIYEDNKLLMDFRDLEIGMVKLKLGFYDSKKDTLKILNHQNFECYMDPEVYAESLISPCF